MIRHSSSFFISFTFHTVLLLIIFFSWKNSTIFHKQENKKQVCVKLSCLVEKRAITKKNKPIIKKLVKPKAPKKVKIIKKKPLTIPLKKKSIKPKIKTKKEVLEQQITKPIYTKKVQKESKQEKQVSVNKEYINNNIQEIVKLLSENLYYPRSARKRGIVGEVIIKFRLSTEATVSETKIVKSQHNILSRAALKTIKELSGKFPKPNEELVLEVPITYELTNP